MSLEIRDLCKKYGDFQAVDRVSFEAEKGQIVGLLGRNGAGKTTTIKCIMRIFSQTSGEVLYDGEKISDEVKIGYLPEERGLYLGSTVKKQLLYFGELNGLDRTRAMEEINRFLNRFGITDRLNDKVKTLSKGNKQKVQLISAILHHPEIVIMDEPFSGLDPVNAELFKSVIKELKDEGAIVLFSSHRMEDVEEMCDRVVMLKNGQVIENDTMQNLIDRNTSENQLIITVDDDIEKIIDEMGLTATKLEEGKYKVIYTNKDELKRFYLNITNSGIGIIESIHPRVTMQEIFMEKMA